MLHCDYVRPASMVELLSLLSEDGDVAVLAGGTDLLVGLRMGKRSADAVIDIKTIHELEPRIVQHGNQVEIGATTTMADLVGSSLMRRHFPAVVQAASIVGSVQIRNRATLAGNICNASPAADTVPALLAYDAEVVLLGEAGHRAMALDAFLLGPGRTARRAAEVVGSVRLPLPQRGTVTSFQRVTRRLGVDLATVNMCCIVSGTRTRLVLGAVGPRAVIVQDDSGLLADATADPSARGDLLESLLDVATPISDVRAGADYRRAMLSVYGGRALQEILALRDQDDNGT